MNYLREAFKIVLADFAKKPLADRGGTPPLNGQSPKNFLKKRVKRAKKSIFLAKNSRVLADFFLNGIGGYPPPPP